MGISDIHWPVLEVGKQFFLLFKQKVKYVQQCQRWYEITQNVNFVNPWVGLHRRGTVDKLQWKEYDEWDTVEEKGDCVLQNCRER